MPVNSAKCQHVVVSKNTELGLMFLAEDFQFVCDKPSNDNNLSPRLTSGTIPQGHRLIVYTEQSDWGHSGIVDPCGDP